MLLDGFKRGPTGVIGSNKPDSSETVATLLENLAHSELSVLPSKENLAILLKQRGVDVITYQDWQKIDAEEIKRGQHLGKCRDKITSLQEVRTILKQCQ